MLNKVILQGRLTKDPELKSTQSGTSVASFSLAVERDYKEKDGSKATDFLNIIAWRGTADFVAKYFHKGDMCLVEGSIQTRSYEDQNGQKRYVTEVIASGVNFCGGKSNDGGAASDDKPAPAKSSKGSTKPAKKNEFEEFDADDDEEVPF